MNKKYYPSIRETLYSDICQNGLRVFLLQKKGFSKTYATLSTTLGGMNHSILRNNKEILLPEGIAHFLEHKLFEQNGKDVSIDFAKLQAKVNAFTQNNKTTYLFTGTDKTIENIDLLLHFVLSANFTEEGIKKEVDIITQEINMYLDNPHVKIYHSLMEQMFPNHPASSEILGQVDSINKLDKKTLEIAHEAFYNPSQMILFIAGNINVEETMNHIKESQSGEKKELNYKIPIIPEDYNPIQVKQSNIEADISSPQLLMGVKLPVYHEKDLVKHDLILGMLLDVLFGKSTDFYQDLLSRELINDTFSKEATLDPSHSYILIGGESKHINELEFCIRKRLQNASQISISSERFELMKKRFIGSFVQAFNYIEFIANNFSKYYFQGQSLFEMLELYQNITIDDIYKMSHELEKEEFYTTVVMNPLKKGA